MTPEQWQTVKSALDAALHADPDDRDVVVGRACGADPVVRAEVERLLAVTADDAFLEPLEVTPASETTGDDLTGRTIGRYRVTRVIASGGMGAVYEAEQAHPCRTVALKVIHADVARPELLRRFELEAQLLGRLQHPGIAQIFEAGTYGMGDVARPFFSMELVRGRTLLDYAHAQGLSVSQRVQLLACICDAVHHAHQRGVIHRDLKPANVMVPDPEPSSANATPQPKVLDFGVARVTDTERSLATKVTAAGALIGTLRYMSPEQLGGDPDEVDLRCDVYALGVIGYELLSGRLPYEPGTGSLAEVARGIVDREPVRLSVADPTLRGDVEAVLHKALQKEPGRRYASAAALADDLRHYLRREPVAARPLTAVYQLRTFARRNPLLVGALVTALLALTAGVLLYAREAGRARDAATVAFRESARADAVSRFLVDMLARIDPNSHGRNVDIVRIVEDAAAGIETTFATEPLTRAAVHDQVGTIFYNLGAYDRAGAHYEAALTAREPLLPADHPDVVSSDNSLGLVALRMGLVDEAIERLERALVGRRRTVGVDDPQTLVTMSNLAMAYTIGGRDDEAIQMLRDALARQMQRNGEVHAETLATMTNLASLCRRRGDLEEAEELHRRALSGMTELHGAKHVAALLAAGNLATTLRRQNELEEAEALYRRAADGLAASVGDDHPDTLTAMHNHARALLALDRAHEAVDRAEGAVAGFRTRAAAQPDALLIALKTFGRCLRAADRETDAVAAFRESLDGYTSRYGADDRRSKELRAIMAGE